MKKYIIGVMTMLLFAACSKTPEQRAEGFVRDYLEQTVDDPSSVELVHLSPLRDAKEQKVGGGTVPVKYMNVTYRTKNAYGALVKKDVVVRFDDDVTHIQCFDCFAY